MGLQERITALAQAVGADMKAAEEAIEALQLGPRITVSVTPPPDPEVNDLWVDISGA